MNKSSYKIIFPLVLVLITIVCSSVVYAQDEQNNKPNLPPEMMQSETTALDAEPDLITDGALDAENFEIITSTGLPEIDNMMLRILLKKPDVNPVQIPTMFFTIYEQNLIADARKGLVARPPTESEIADSIDEEQKNKPREKGVRELALGGIIYKSSNNWTVWLNGEKITPDRLPSEVLDIRVHKDYLKLKWYDSYTNQIFPIKLRTHQRFNIDTRIFLPG